MNIPDDFDPEELVDIALRNQRFILQRELETGVPLNYLDRNGQYVFHYQDGTILPASFELSFEENMAEHRKIMAQGK